MRNFHSLRKMYELVYSKFFYLATDLAIGAIHLLTRTFSRSPHRPPLPQPSTQDRTDEAAATSIRCPAPPRLAPCKPRTHPSTGSHRTRTLSSSLRRPGSSSPPNPLFPRSSTRSDAEAERGETATDRGAEMSSDSSSWARALTQISPYTFSAIGIAVSIGVSVLGAAW